jgi:hypothetical protein
MKKLPVVMREGMVRWRRRFEMLNVIYVYAVCLPIV